MRKFYILSLIFVFGFAFCLTDGFADKVGGTASEAVEFADDNFMLVEGFEFPTPDGAVHIQDPPDSQRAPEKIIGDPDFEKMRNIRTDSQDYQLGRKVGMIAIQDQNDPNQFIPWCTGFLVGPDLFMTNHHCAYDESDQFLFENAAILMDYYQDLDVDPTGGGMTARVSEVLQADDPKDYALLRLDKPIGNTYGWLELDTTTVPNSGQNVKLISHPAGRSKEIVRDNSEIVDIPADDPLTDVAFVLAYLADSEQGSSGSPVFLREGTGVIAIHHSGPKGFNAGSLMSHIVPEIQQDLVVETPQVTKDWLRPGVPFTLSVTVRNLGAVASSATTLRFYESFDSSITTSDVKVGEVSVDSLAPFGSSEVRISLTPPPIGTHYYGACVDAVANEADTDNNCSTGVSVTVSSTLPIHMYWSDWRTEKIQQATLNGTNVKDIIVGLSSPHGIALDVAADQMYWTDYSEGSIQRANLDGSNIEILVTGLGDPPGLALDVAGDKMYWTDRAAGIIQRADLDGSNIEILVTELGGPEGLALDVAGGKMYWTDRDDVTDSIQRANLDGSNVEVLIPTGSGLCVPEGLTLDVAGGKMYWTDYCTDRIQRANLNGTDIETLVVASGQDPVSITLDTAEGKMYWVAQNPGRIQRANLNGTDIENLVTTRLGSPYSIALGIPHPSTSLIFNPRTIADQTLLVDTPITSLALPVAMGGTPPYTYTLSPIPAGLDFTEDSRSLSGTPTTIGTANVTYTATDEAGESTTLTFTITVTGFDPRPLDVNADGQVDVLDLALVAVFYGTRGDGLPADVNADGIVNVQDFAAVAAGVDAADDLSLPAIEPVLAAAAEQEEDLDGIAEAPMGSGNLRRDVLSGGVAVRNIAATLADARHIAETGDARLRKGIALLETLLQLLTEMGTIPETTALLPNYPNPFNPETWLPYQLATPTEVTLSIYSIDGRLVRTLDLGHQPAGVYQSKHRAAYWDSKNQLGEKVASGVYFYTLTAGEFTATRKMLIAK